MKKKVLIVEARYYEDIAEALLAGAKAKLDAAGYEYDLVTVPGALEIPPAIAIMSKNCYAGYVALGCVIRGETYHFEIVANGSTSGLMDLALAKNLAIGNGILTVDNGQQALARAKADESNKGAWAAFACLELIKLKENMHEG
ncbi:6,7-dimethyl-8-ribityllumazine synthase [Bartonella sp. TP]|uniref:6,7-dimethyl-8-ribityllumazine synthase n=1 Tax=Bartonella sp. TP TaxID=3057550 RepID=UPI0025B22A98|nr:6,7-dimethyl-8-ribityllumazine synthase [Bartonella sp. TP]MDN5248776.1 6,7-dimethyl-8-ribityllumazine synthase [Alphaproteobacteria bacterium]WJW80040.1 6,7-dimethyl-8-ribityllumazine synthase [Bartonella sp. TP]